MKSRPRCGYQVFSSQIWFKVKGEFGAGAGFAEISREVGNQVNGWIDGACTNGSCCMMFVWFGCITASILVPFFLVWP